MKELKGFFCFLLLLSVLSVIPVKAAGAAEVQKLDTQPPEAPKGLAVAGKTCTSVSLSWTGSSDNVKVKGYYIYRDGKKIITTSKTYYTNSDLIPGRKYTYAVRAYDTAYNISDVAGITAVTDPDDKPPTVPENLSLSAHDYTSVNVSWNPSTDNTSVKGYEVYRNGSRVASTTATGYTVKGLLPGTTYSFYVKAYDIAGNYSGQSGSIPGSTLPDTKAPEKPSGLKGTSVTETQITLMWSPSSDNVRVKGYEVYCNGEKKGTAAKAIYTAKNLIPGKSYSYTVVAFDTVGNRSVRSEPVEIMTLMDDEKPSAPTGLKAVKTKGSSVSLKWDASSDNTKVNGYIIYCNGMELAKTKKTSRTVTNKLKPVIGIYWVKAYDLAGNFSDASNKLTVITP